MKTPRLNPVTPHTPGFNRAISPDTFFSFSSVRQDARVGVTGTDVAPCAAQTTWRLTYRDGSGLATDIKAASASGSQKSATGVSRQLDRAQPNLRLARYPIRVRNW